MTKRDFALIKGLIEEANKLHEDYNAGITALSKKYGCEVPPLETFKAFKTWLHGLHAAWQIVTYKGKGKA